MGLRDFLRNRNLNKEKFKEMQEERRLQKMVEDREKSSDERELERFLKEEREKEIRENLKRFREKRKQEVNSMSVLRGGNIFKGHKNVMSGKATIMKNNDSLFSARMKGNRGGHLFFLR